MSYWATALDQAESGLIQLKNQPDFACKFTQMVDLFSKTLQAKRRLLICGNGGSLCDAMHFAEEFTGRFRTNRPALPVIALSDPAHLTCVGNDFGFDEVFSRGVEAFAQPNDVLIVLSTSGNSANILRALTQAKTQAVHTVAFLGKTGGACAGLSDIEWIVPGSSSDRIQELHMLMLHIAIEGVERTLFPETYVDS
jgi:D-sedoheptulose 7-phosphate isomerase